MEQATVGTGPVLPEGYAGRGMNLIPDFTHDFYLVGGPGVRCAVSAEARATGRRAASLGRWRWVRIWCGGGRWRRWWWSIATAIPTGVGRTRRGGRIGSGAGQGPLLRVNLVIGDYPGQVASRNLGESINIKGRPIRREGVSVADGRKFRPKAVDILGG